MGRKRRWILAIGGVATLVVVGLLVVASRVPLSSDTLRRRVIETLSDRLKSDVELQGLTLRFSPRLHAVGTGLVVHYRGRRDVPPLFQVDSFTVSASLSGLWRRRVDVVRLDGLAIQIPPDRNDDDAPAAPDQGAVATTASAHADEPANTASNEPGTESSMQQIAKQIVITELQAPAASLTILRSDPKKPARVWYMHSLRLQEVGIETAMPFESRLTNAVPPGEIDVSGRFGPWAQDDPGRTPINGQFTFANADLSVFKGISGILSAKGEIGGALNQIVVDGETDTPDFMVNISGHQVPLKTRYHAIVNGTNGNTTLDPVNATFLDTSLEARGGVYELEDGPGREVRLDVAIDGGRLQDVMRLAVKTPQPPMSGVLHLQTSFVIPPGKVDIVEKLQLRGRFAIDRGRFTNADVQQKVTTLSQRARGKTAAKATPGEKVTSDFTGQFALGRGRLALPQVTFDVPGAVVALKGDYGMRSETLAFNGDLFMDAKISQTTTGFKSLLLKIVDPLFRRDGRTVIPLKVSGTRNDPQFGLDVKRVFKRGDSAPPAKAKPAPRTPAARPAPRPSKPPSAAANDAAAIPDPAAL